MKIQIATIFVLILNNVAHAQTPDLSQWKMDTLPTGDRIYPANHSRHDWIFVQKSDKWIITESDYKKEIGDSLPLSTEFINKNLNKIGTRFTKKVYDGYLVGFNKGEFGGGLYFVSNDGQINYELAGYLNIKSIFEYNNKLFAIEGLAHLGGQRGQIIELFKDSIWKYKSVTQLVEAPEIISDYNGEKIIITSQYILKYTKDFQVREILKSPFYWGMLYPSTILFDKNEVFLAMRHGVLRILHFDTTPEYEWYTRK
jgi:hypothetical protein